MCEKQIQKINTEQQRSRCPCAPNLSPGLYNHTTLNFHSKFYEEFVFYFAPLEIAIIFKEMQFKETWIIQLRVSWLYISLKTHLHAIYSM